jgi:hypothetical protein
VQGIILLGFRRFVLDRYSDSTWRAAQESASLAGTIYLPVQSYRDSELSALVAAVARITKSDAQELLESFGELLAPDLLRMYGMLLDPRWKLLDILANAGPILRRIGALRHESRTSPDIQSAWRYRNEVALSFSMRQPLCAMVSGVIQGFAAHLNEPVRIAPSTCTRLGQPRCGLSVKTLAPLGRLRRSLPPDRFSSRPPPPQREILPGVRCGSDSSVRALPTTMRGKSA